MMSHRWWAGNNFECVENDHSVSGAGCRPGAIDRMHGIRQLAPEKYCFSEGCQGESDSGHVTEIVCGFTALK